MTEERVVATSAALYRGTKKKNIIEIRVVRSQCVKRIMLKQVYVCRCHAFHFIYAI